MVMGMGGMQNAGMTGDGYSSYSKEYTGAEGIQGGRLANDFVNSGQGSRGDWEYNGVYYNTQAEAHAAADADNAAKAKAKTEQDARDKAAAEKAAVEKGIIDSRNGIVAGATADATNAASKMGSLGEALANMKPITSQQVAAPNAIQYNNVTAPTVGQGQQITTSAINAPNAYTAQTTAVPLVNSTAPVNYTDAQGPNAVYANDIARTQVGTVGNIQASNASAPSTIQAGTIGSTQVGQVANVQAGAYESPEQKAIREKQLAAIAQYEKAAAGDAGSVAQIQQKQSFQEALMAQRAMLASQRGGYNAALGRSTAVNVGNLQAQQAQAAALLRAKEMEDARAGLGNALLGVRGQDLTLLTEQEKANLAAQQSNQQKDLTLSTTQAGLDAQRQLQQVELELDAAKKSGDWQLATELENKKNQLSAAQSNQQTNLAVNTTQASIDSQAAIRQVELQLDAAKKSGDWKLATDLENKKNALTADITNKQIASNENLEQAKMALTNNIANADREKEAAFKSGDWRLAADVESKKNKLIADQANQADQQIRALEQARLSLDADKTNLAAQLEAASKAGDWALAARIQNANNALNADIENNRNQVAGLNAQLASYTSIYNNAQQTKKDMFGQLVAQVEAEKDRILKSSLTQAQIDAQMATLQAELSARASAASDAQESSMWGALLKGGAFLAGTYFGGPAAGAAASSVIPG